VTSPNFFARAIEHHRAGRTASAESGYRKVLEQEPRHDQALYLLGTIALETSRLEEALDLFKQAIALAPHMPAYHTNLGVTLRRLRRTREAVDAFYVALSLKPDFAEALFNVSMALEDLGEDNLAYHALERATDFKPDSYEMQFQFACALVRRRDFERAIGHFHCALCLNPKSLDCIVELGAVLRTIGRPRGAISLAQRALVLFPDSAIVHSELGLALFKDDKLDEAIEMLSKAIQLQPTLAEAHGMLGNAYTEVGRALEGIDAYRRALQIRATWADLHSNLLYVMTFAPGYSDQTINNEARLWNELHATSGTAIHRDHDNDRRADRRVRVGYVSPHFASHCQSFFTLPLFAHHNREQFEIFCYASNKETDEITRQLQSRVDTWRDVLRLNNSQLVDAVREDRIDILVDLTLHMENGRLVAQCRHARLIWGQSSFVTEKSRMGKVTCGSGVFVFRQNATRNLVLVAHYVQARCGNSTSVLWLLPLAMMMGCGRCSPEKKAGANGNANAAVASNSAQGAAVIGGPIGEILAFNSLDCPSCANVNCRTFIDKCLNIEGDATDGPAKGKPKSELCIDTLRCTIKGRCASEDASVFCYCGTTNGDECISGNKQNGSCKAKIEAGLETTSSQQIIVNSWHNEKTGGGIALSLVDCLGEKHCRTCF